MVNLSDPQKYIITSLQNICLFMAGVGSGKTYIIGFLSGYYILNFPKVPGFIGANTYMQLSQSTLFRVRKVWSEIYGWEEGEDYVVSKRPPKSYDTETHDFVDYRSIVSFKNGTVVFVGSLDNASAHDGKEFGWAFLDETKDTREDDVKETILTRLRTPGIYKTSRNKLTDVPRAGKHIFEAFNPLYILTSPAKVRWLNEWFNLDEYQHEIQSLIYNEDEFFTKEFGQMCVVISSTYHNQENLPKGFIEKLLAAFTDEKVKKMVYGNPFVRSGGEFYSEFQRMKHVRPVKFDPTLPIHVSFDQNVVPYITATLYQLQGGTVAQFDEICLENPKNKTSKLCLEIIKRYGHVLKQCGLFFYGDPAGKHRDTRGTENDYQIIERYLRPYLNNRSNRVPRKHPPVLKRKDFANDLFEGNLDGYDFVVDPKCKKSISDFEFVKEDKNGKKSKEKKKDPNTGITYEPYGHTSDSFDYFLCKLLERLFERRSS